MDFYFFTMKRYYFYFVFDCAFNNVAYILLTICFFYPVANSVAIKRLSIPRWVQNGTEDAVILDCDYVYNENDLHLVVKWYFGDSPMPIYQWIPELNSRNVGPGVLEGRLDLDFAVNAADAYSRFRALRILRPTTDLSGKYTCQVTSLASIDTQEQNMTVYVPAKHFNLILPEMTNNVLNVTCEAKGLFPMPDLKLSSSQSRKTNSFISNTEAETIILPGQLGTYDISAYRTFSAWELAKNPEIEFECSLEIPGTNYTRVKRITYFPGVLDSRIDAYSSAVLVRIHGQVIFLAISITLFRKLVF